MSSLENNNDKEISKEKIKEKKVKKVKKEKNKDKLKKDNKIIRVIKNGIFKDTTFTVLLVVAVLSAYIAINVGIKALDITDIDLTKEKYYSISEESKNQIKDINDQITMYFFGYKEDSSVVDLAKQYSKYKDNIKVEMVSTESRQDIAKEYDISTTDEQNGIVVIATEDKSVKTNNYDFYTYDYNTGETIDLTEQKLTNSILAVTLEKSPKLYFLTGHNEYKINEYFNALATELSSEVNEFEELDLLVKNEIPSDCQALIIASPTTDFTDYETDLIIKYINNGGDILWLADYSKSGTLKNVKKILDLYGVSNSDDGIILEQDTSSMLMQNPQFIIPSLNENSEITGPIASGGKVLFIYSGKIDVKPEEELKEINVSVTELLKTSDQAFFRTNLSEPSAKATNDEEVKSYTLGVSASKLVKEEEEDEDKAVSKLILYSNGIFATDQPIQIQNQTPAALYFYNNRDLVLNSISYLTERTDTITIRKTFSSVPYTPTETQDNVVKIIIFVLPLIIIAVGIIVWVLRKRRK